MLDQIFNRRRSSWPTAPAPSTDHNKPMDNIIVPCGQPNEDKTAALNALYYGPLQHRLPSGQFYDVDDPKRIAKIIGEQRAMKRSLSVHGFASTVQPNQHVYYLYDGEQPRCRVTLWDEVGQVLSHTRPDSPREQQKAYEDYVQRLATAHVIWLFISPPPPQPTIEDLEAYHAKLALTRTYLRHVMSLGAGRPRPVGVLLTKIDSLFPNEEAARSDLDDEKLAEIVGPLCDSIVGCREISDACIIPISAWGWGNAEPKAHGTNRFNQDDNSDGISGGTEWVLKAGHTIQPYNLTPLLVWSSLMGLLPQQVDVDGDDHPMAATCRRLVKDLAALDGWLLPIKGRLVGNR